MTIRTRAMHMPADDRALHKTALYGEPPLRHRVLRKLRVERHGRVNPNSPRPNPATHSPVRRRRPTIPASPHPHLASPSLPTCGCAVNLQAIRELIVRSRRSCGDCAEIVLRHFISKQIANK